MIHEKAKLWDRRTSTSTAMTSSLAELANTDLHWKSSYQLLKVWCWIKSKDLTRVRLLTVLLMCMGHQWKKSKLRCLQSDLVALDLFFVLVWMCAFVPTTCSCSVVYLLIPSITCECECIVFILASHVSVWCVCAYWCELLQCSNVSIYDCISLKHMLSCC